MPRACSTASPWVCREISKGNFEVRLVNIEESGQLATAQHAVNDMIDRCDAFVREASAAMDAVRHHKYYRRILREGLHGSLDIAATIINGATAAIQRRVTAFDANTAKFESSIETVVDTLSNASSAMGDTAGKLSHGASVTRERSTAVAAATEDAAANMQTVAAVTTKLTEAGHDIRMGVDRSTQIARQAVARAGDANRTMQDLSGGGRPHRQGGEPDRHHRVADQPARAQCRDRGGACRRNRQGLRRGRAGSEDAVEPDHRGDPGNFRVYRQGAVDHQERGRCHRSDRRHHQRDRPKHRPGHAGGDFQQVAATDEIAHSVDHASSGMRNITSAMRDVTENAGETESYAATTTVASSQLLEQSHTLATDVQAFLLTLRRGAFDDKAWRSRATFGTSDRNCSGAGAPDLPPDFDRPKLSLAFLSSCGMNGTILGKREPLQSEQMRASGGLPCRIHDFSDAPLRLRSPACWARPVSAQPYPARDITFIVAFAPGGVADTVARLVGQGLSARLGRNVVVENRGGAGGNIAAAAVARAAPDGYTLLVTTTAVAINETLRPNKGFAASDLKPIAIVASSPESLVTSASNPAANLADFIKAAQGKSINFGTAGVGSGSHIAAEYFFKEIAKISAVHVPFQGGAPAINATIGNQIDLLATTLGGGAAAQIAGGKLKGLGVASAKRAAVVPNVPTYAEAGYPNFEAASWVGVFAPANTSPEIVAKLNATIEEVMKDPALRQKLTSIGFDPIEGSQAQAETYFKAEVEKWGKMVKTLGLSIN